MLISSWVFHEMPSSNTLNAAESGNRVIGSIGSWKSLYMDNRKVEEEESTVRLTMRSIEMLLCLQCLRRPKNNDQMIQFYVVV